MPVSSDLVAVSFPNAEHRLGRRSRRRGAEHDRRRRAPGQRSSTATQPAPQWSITTRARPQAHANDPKRGNAAAEEAKRFAAQGAENPLLDVWFDDDKSGFVVGAFGLILRTTDGGTSWEPWLHAIDNPKGLHLYAVRAVGGDV